MVQVPRISWTSSGLSTWLNHSARLAARRRPRSSSGSFNWRSRLVTSSRAVTWPMLGRVPSVRLVNVVERSEAAREEFAVDHPLGKPVDRTEAQPQRQILQTVVDQ